MEYDQPGLGDNQVQDGAHTPLGSSIGTDVVDGAVPTLESISADSAASPDQVTLHFSEPVACNLAAGDLDVLVDTVNVDDRILDIACVTPEATPVVQFVDGTLTAGVEVSVTVVGAVSDESRDNEVDSSSVATTTAT